MTRLLVLGAVWPEPDSSAAGAHILQVLSPFLGLDWEVTYASTALESEHAVDLSALRISAAHVKVNDPGFDAWIRSLQPDAVIFDRFYLEEQFGWRVEEHCSNALRILNLEDLHSLREAREVAHRQGASVQKAQLKSQVARREVAAILRSDLSLIISEHEMEVLACSFEVEPDLLHYCPFMIDPPALIETQQMPSFAKRRDFVWIGNFLHAPNADGVEWLKNDIWPLIRKALPEARLRIAGAYANSQQKALHDADQGFIVDGRIDQADARFLESRVCLAPLRFGAGLKGKLIDAMRNGTPSVTTAIGAEGIAGDLPWAGAVEESAASIAKSAIRLYESETEWEDARTKGFEILRHRFDRNVHERLLVDQVFLAREQIHPRRERNFVGSILRDHHHRSTRYLSKWIEAKDEIAAQRREPN
jgi:O-antigen biosynthesis protein